MNMLSSEFMARSVRDGEAHTVHFAAGIQQDDIWESGVNERTGTLIRFVVDEEVFGEYSYNLEYVETLIKNYTYLNLGLTIKFNGQSYSSKNGLLDLLNENMTEEPLYEPIHLTGKDIEVAITHGTGYGESYCLVNGQHTTAGRDAPKRSSVRRSPKRSASFTIRITDASDIRTSIVAAISVKIIRSGV
ncbi:MAG: hypothetical protein ACLR8Y_14065 [Alistipes indistinctus]